MSPRSGQPAAAADEIRLRVDKLVGGGRALGHHDGTAIFVAGALPGEDVVATPTAHRAGIVEADLMEVVRDRHQARTDDPCPHSVSNRTSDQSHGPCGGCDWPHVEPEAGSALKAVAAAEAARRFPEPAERLATASVRTSDLAYRLRARLHWDPARGLLGFYARRSWTVVPIPSCRIVSPRLAGAIDHLTTALIARCPVPADLEWLEDLESGTAVAALRPAADGPDSMEESWIPDRDAVAEAVDGFHALSTSGIVRPVWGAESVTMNLPIALGVPIGAFFQGNRHLTPWLFERTAELVGSRPVPVFDLHAGVGLLAAAARHAADRELQLVEPFRPAARAAVSNLPGARVAAGRTAEAFLNRARNLPREAVVLTDPPRAGMSSTLRHRLAGWHPHRILTLACDPVTWARDTSFLIDRGYRLTHVELVDLFPSTHHVEVLAVLESG